MSSVPVQIIVAAFNDENAASEALEQLKEAKKEKLIGIIDAAIIRRDEQNKLHIKETADMSGGKGAAVGGVLGGILGLIGGPAGIALGAAAGAAVGGVAAKAIDAGIPNERLEEIGEALKPGTSAIVAIIEHKWVQQAQDQLAQAGADVMTAALKADIAEQLAAGKDVTYTALATDEGMAAVRLVGDGEQAPVPAADTAEAPAASAASVAEAGEESTQA